MTKQTITPCLWYDQEAKEAAEFYVTIFGGQSNVHHVSTFDNSPSGSVDMVSFELLGTNFLAISAGPQFKFTPAISFHVKCYTHSEVDTIWEKLSDGAKVLMELGSYPFSERYGWLEDKYGVSWQIIFVDEEPSEQRIVPILMFVGDVCGKAGAAIDFYTSVFRDAGTRFMMPYGPDEHPDEEGSVKYADFVLEGMQFGAMDSAYQHDFAFNEAISLMVSCDTQADIDYYWEKLSAVPEAEQCGWLKDKYGVSWQIVPSVLAEVMSQASPEEMARITGAFLEMKKFDLAVLERAAKGE